MLRARAYAETRRLRPAVRRFAAAARRNRVVLALVYVALLATIGWAHAGGTFEAFPAGVLAALAIAGTAGQIALARTRRRAVLVAAAAVLAAPLAAAAFVVVVGSRRATTGAEEVAALATGVAVTAALGALATRGAIARAKELVVIAFVVVTWAFAPLAAALAVVTGREAAANTAAALVLDAVWWLGALVAQALFAPAPAPVADTPPAVRGPRAHVAAARTFALVLLAPVYLGFDLARFVRTGDEATALARKALVFGVTAAALDRTMPGPVTLDEVVPGIGVVRGAPACREGRCSGVIAFTTPDGTHQELFVADANDTKGAIARAHTALVGTAVYLGAPASKDATDRELYVAIRDKVEARTVRMPVIDLELGSARARWALGVVVLAILVLTRNRLGAALRDGGQSDDEPWLLLDTGDRLERTIAGGYLVVVAGASTAVAAELLVAVSRDLAGGTLAAVLVFWALGTWLSLAIAARILALRVRRLAGVSPPTLPPAPRPVIWRSGRRAPGRRGRGRRGIA